MKIISSSILLTLLIFSTLHLPSSFAQDYTQWSLPKDAKARIGKGMINDMQYSPDGTILAVASSVGIWLYDAETYQELALLTRHTDGVGNISFSPDGATLVSTEWFFDNIVLWDVATRKEKKVLTNQNSATAVFSPDGTTLVSTNFKTIHLWDARTGELQHTLTGHTLRVSSLSFSPDGSTLASGNNDETIRLWDVATGTHKKTLVGHNKPVSNIAFSPDGGTLVSVSGNRTVHLWDIATGEVKKVLADGGMISGGGTIQSMSFSADGGTFANVSHNKTIYLWDTATGSIKRTLTNAFEMNDQVGGKVVNVSFGSDEKTLIIWRSGGLIRLWNADTEEYKSLAKDAGYVTRVVLNPDGSTLATGNFDGTIRLWNTSTGEQKKTIANQRFKISHDYVIKSGRDTKGMGLSHKGDKLAAGIGFSTPYLWDAITRRHQPLVGNTNESEGSWFNGVLFSPDGNTFASWSFSRYKGIHLWDVATGTRKRTLTGGHTSVLASVSFSPDGGTLATGSWDKTVRLWDVATGTHKKTLKMHTEKVEATLFSLDGETFVSGDIAGTIQLWEAATGKHKQTLKRHTSGVSSMAFTRDGHTLAVGSVDGTIYLWDTDTGQHKQTFTGHADAVASIVFNSDGLNFASTSEDGTVRLWDTDTGEQKKTLTAYKGTGWCVSFYTDGWMLASRFEDDNTHGNAYWPRNTYWPQSKNVELWDLATGQRLKSLKGHTGDVVSILFSTDGRTLASGSDDGTILLWDLAAILNVASETQ